MGRGSRSLRPFPPGTPACGFGSRRNLQLSPGEPRHNCMLRASTWQQLRCHHLGCPCSRRRQRASTPPSPTPDLTTPPGVAPRRHGAVRVDHTKLKPNANCLTSIFSLWRDTLRRFPLPCSRTTSPWPSPCCPPSRCVSTSRRRLARPCSTGESVARIGFATTARPILPWACVYWTIQNSMCPGTAEATPGHPKGPWSRGERALHNVERRATSPNRWRRSSAPKCVAYAAESHVPSLCGSVGRAR
jgi:hypothetical protein